MAEVAAISILKVGLPQRPGRTYAVGDIHGRFDLLTKALAWIETDAQLGGPCEIVFLGDYIDRGPSSADVIARLMKGPNRPIDRFVCLLGNHEEMMLNAQRGWEEPYELWLQNGGGDTLASYGGAIPSDHIAWMKGLPRKHEDAYRFYVHAGVNPKRALSNQTDYDLVWIRDRFLRGNHDMGKHVVHGHTPMEDGPELRAFRTNLDVGAVWTGRLAIGVFDPSKLGGPFHTQLVELGASS